MAKAYDDRTCRLLSAAELAYDIDASGNLTGFNQKVYDRVGFVETPQSFTAGEDDINAVLVGKNRADGVIVAYRGTLAPDFKGKTEAQDLRILLDWIDDLFVQPISAPGLEGKVDENFFGAVESLWPQVTAAVKELGGGSAPVFVTGHSKGGPMASIASALLAKSEGITPQGVFLFASPRPGDATFASFYEGLIPKTVRYEYQDDLVPHLPPTEDFAKLLADLPLMGKVFAEFAKWNFVPVGNLFFIDWQNQVVDVAQLSRLRQIELEIERTTNLAKLMLEGKFTVIGDDHALAGGYCNALCGSGASGPNCRLRDPHPRPLSPWERGRG
ncbi:MAG: lipase family protein [Acidobacteria bacterium]|nr:lipase family protein [Acidobacteriota bacterium]